MKVWLSRWVCADVESNLDRFAAEVAEAAAAGAAWAVFPESFLNGYTRTVDATRTREVFAHVSASHPQMVLFPGSFTEQRRNRMSVWQGGRELAHYDKVHLFPPNRELEIWERGDRYVAVDVGSERVGLLNCNDLRFPEQARALRLEARCTALVVVAWWPWRRDWVWRTLLRARAIENGVWVAGCCVAASHWRGETFAGAGCHVFDPHGEPVRTADDRVFDLDPRRAANLVVDPLEQALEVDRVEVFTPLQRGGR